MHTIFAQAIEGLHLSFETLIKMDALSGGQLPPKMPKSGIYLFSEPGKHLYVGRSRDMRRRYGLHTRPSAQSNQSSFAFLLAREAIDKRRTLSRRELSEHTNFEQVFTAAKCRIRAMEYRFVEETDPTRQALLEIYCAVVLSTSYNSFDTH